MRIFDKIDSFLGRLVFRTLGVIMILAGIFPAYFGLRSFLNSLEYKNWPTTEGVVSSSIISSSSRASYRPIVEYDFLVKGKEYHGYGINVAVGKDEPYKRGSGSSLKKSKAQKIVKRYPPGSIVKIYYSADNPLLCLLEPEINYWSLVLSFIGIGFITGGVLLFRQKRKLSDIDFD